MAHSRYTSEEIVQRGQEIYEEQIRAEVEADYTGKFLVVDIETGMYEIDVSELAAFDRARAKHPDSALYLLCIGHAAAYRIGRGQGASVNSRLISGFEFPLPQGGEG